MGKRFQKKGRHFKRLKFKYKVIIFILSIIMLASIIYLWQYFKSNQSLKAESNLLNSISIDNSQVNSQKTERMLKVEELQKENSDIVGWIEIEDTNINYPVLQATDNSFYMNHNYKKEENTYGSIFLDKDYDWNIPSSNLLLYGHNLQNGSLFHDILNYKDKSYYKEHPTIRFTTENKDSEFEIISAFYSRVYYKSEKNVFRYYYFVNADNEEEYNEFVDSAKEASIYDTGKTAEYGDQLITLSTCSYHTEDGRFAVVAREK